MVTLLCWPCLQTPQTSTMYQVLHKVLWTQWQTSHIQSTLSQNLKVRMSAVWGGEGCILIFELWGLFVVVVWVLAFWDRVLYCHPGWLEMCCVDKVGLKFVAILFPQTKNRKLKKGYRDSSSGMGPCQQCWQFQFNPQNLLSRRKKPAPVKLPSDLHKYTMAYRQTDTHTHMHTQRNCRK